MGKVLYRSRIVGLDSSWVYTSATQNLNTSFKPGKFTFEVEAQNSNGVWGTPATLAFTVDPPYWQRIWFIILFTLLASGFLYLIYYIRLSELKKRNELISNINLYKQQSLRQQMNPHFIFNTLNSIQYYILEKDTISSHKYLTKFARLMRFTLDNSLHSAIPLRDELESLRLYLELEALRLQGKFTYDIDYQNNESVLDIKIPTLMIQPFVENAIWHGIMLKPDKSGHVQVTISDMETSVLCTIEDNGVGREQARKIQETSNKAHRSRGFQITQQRIDLLNSMYGQKFNIQIVDLYSHDGTPQGTRVTINIPKGIESS
jgi:LytS/YehU family sensor histidine kinase